MDFTGKLGIYKIIETQDKTKTLWSEFFDENCHNLSGAYEETLYNYIHGCHIPEKLASKGDLHVLDVGFGLGIGLKALIDEVKKTPSNAQAISYTSIELDEDLFLWSVNENFPEITFQKEGNAYKAEYPINGNAFIATVFIGDGRKTLIEAFKNGKLPAFGAIFQDAFSPKKNPTLWTTEWFVDLKNMSAPDVCMSTYSSSVSIRKSMIAAGWVVANKKGFGQKRTMTTAKLTGEIDATLQAELSRSPTLELRDI